MPTVDGHSWGFKGVKPRHGFRLSNLAAVYMGVKGEQKPVEFDPIEYGFAGPVRMLADMSEAERRKLCQVYRCEIVALDDYGQVMPHDGWRFDWGL